MEQSAAQVQEQEDTTDVDSFLRELDDLDLIEAKELQEGLSFHFFRFR